ncbi:MAG TPA: polysaccharide deacetylase family protein [Candidatus Copromorpha excrementigallinarum]|uniref:Polysaccharide deacetylase family protein n=1 Tax=Candidatus Allocopromorpha excrementigallinarum TaxID=2840742 RepID=A0A9D1L5S5_9FIRM|nr:polysaccharide deacetylase family protein [Candidatus Copromorpha excrementigallinarum]
MKKNRARVLALGSLILCIIISLSLTALMSGPLSLTAGRQEDPEEPIKWVDFNVPYHVLKRAMDTDIETYDEKIHVSWIDILAYLGARYGGDFSSYRDSHMDSFVEKVKKGVSAATAAKGLEHFSYYSRAYGAVLGGLLGEYQIRLPDEESGKNVWKKAYGLKAFSPLADGFYYSDFDDFGESRSYGYTRKHLGHDMMTSVGTPVIAVESGTVEALGWNQYGGWRIGIRSYDKERYYYYAHLRKDSPFAENLRVGSSVTAGDVIGYTGQTGYSIKENVNNIDTPHLHLGLQLIFDEKAKDSPDQIWVDMYQITRLLSSHRSTVVKDEDTGQYQRKYMFSEENHYLKEMLASAETTDAREVELPIIMYHSIMESKGVKNRYIVSPDTFEKDLRYIKKKGYTPVFMKDVISFVEGGGSLPKKPIVITFDDGYYNNYYYAYPLLRKYNMKAVISIVGKMTDDFTAAPDFNLSYSYVTWDHVLDMHLSGYWEIQNHSYNCHSYDLRNGVAQVYNETDSHYRDFLMGDVCGLQDKIAYVTGVAPNTFTYPFGSFNENTDTVLKEIGFKATLSCTEGISTIRKGDPQCLYRLDRYLRPPGVSSEEFFSFLS